MTSALHEQRIAAVLAVLDAASAATIIDLGCGDGDLLLRLIANPAVRHVTGMELVPALLARLRASLAALPAAQRDKVRLLNASMTEPPLPARGEAPFDAAVMLETIEHVSPERLSEVERALFARLKPKLAIITTPNADYNPVLGVPSHRFRHPEHKFEWGRAKFRAWAEGAAARHGYAASLSDIAGDHPTLGGSSQMAVFTPAQPTRAT